MNRFPFYLILLLPLFISSQVFAQTLEFSQVLKKELQFTQATTADPYIVTNDTVPPGKVWKIMGIGTGTWLGAIGGTNNLACCTSQEFYLDHVRVSNASTYNAFPYWIAEGPHTLGMQVISSTSSSRTSLLTVSIIEFNVVP